MRTLRCAFLFLIVFLTSCNRGRNIETPTGTPTAIETPLSMATITPTTTVLPPTATLTPTATLPPNMAEWLIPIDGHAFRVLYDETVWELRHFDNAEVKFLKYEGLGLAHRSIPECAILGIRSIETPEGWRVETKDVQPGEHVFSVKEFYDPNGRLSFAVYGSTYRLDFPADSEKCRQDAEQVLSTYKTVIVPTPVATPTLAPNMAEWLITFKPGKAFRLVYDKAIWTMREEFTGIEYLPATGPGLSHRSIPKCSILMNMGTEAYGWTMEIRDVMLGGHRFSKREFYGEAGQLPLAIYDGEFRVDFPIEPEKCLHDAEQVLATYQVVNLP